MFTHMSPQTYRLQNGERYFNTHDRKMHWDVWEYHNGSRRKGYHIHHIDGNAQNNRIENLEEVEASKHLSNHQKQYIKDNPKWFKEFYTKGTEAAKLWAKTPEGRKRKSETSKRLAQESRFWEQTFGEAECKQCSTEFTRQTTEHDFCSNRCKSAWRRSKGIDNVTRICKWCKKEWTLNKYSKAKCCSKMCASKNRFK